MDIYKRDFAHLTMPATSASFMLKLAESRGISADQLLEGTDLSATDLHQRNARIQLWQQSIIVSHLLKLTNDPSLSIEIGLHSSITKMGSMGYGLMSCSSLQEAIELGLRFLPLQVPFFKLDFGIEDNMAIITVRDAIPFIQSRVFAIENFLIEVAEIFRSLLIVHTRPDRYEQLQLYFDYPEPAYFAAYKERLPPLHFNQPANQFRFPASLLKQSIHTANPAAVQLAITQGESELAKFGLIENWLDRVKALIVCHEGKYPDLPMLASQLHLSERTLKRKLAELETSFSELLDEVRQRDACKLLDETTLTIDDIALRLGFQDRSNFTRAFRRWLGVPPSQYRNNCDMPHKNS